MHRHLPIPFVPALFAALLASPLCAQDAPAAEPVAPIATAKDIADAVRGLLDAKSMRLVGSVSMEKPEDGDDPFGGMVMQMGGSNADHFSGAVEVLRRDGKTLIASAEELPGVAVFDNGSPRRIKQLTVADEDIDLARLARDLPDLLTARRLLKEVERGTWSFVRDAATGAITATGKLRAKLIKSSSSAMMEMGMMPSMEPSVEHVEATFVLDTEKALVSAKFAVVRFNPESVMMRKLMAGAADGAVEMDPTDLDFEKDKTPADLSSDVYTLRVAPADAPSPRAERLFEDFVELEKSGK